MKVSGLLRSLTKIFNPESGQNLPAGRQVLLAPRKPNFGNSGQTLVVLLVFMVVAVTITSAAVIVTLVNSQSATRLEQGEVTLGIAEAGMENAILRLLRDPGYTGETLTLPGGSATIVVSGTTTKTITVTANNGNFTRKIQATADSNNILNLTSWQEIY